jgi:hypothetical protein
MGNEVKVTFAHCGSGLKTSNGKAPQGFMLQHSDGRFYMADAKIVSDSSVVVSKSTVPTPTEIRFHWENNPDVNLYNSDDWPAAPFVRNINGEPVATLHQPKLLEGRPGASYRVVSSLWSNNQAQPSLLPLYTLDGRVVAPKAQLPATQSAKIMIRPTHSGH